MIKAAGIAGAAAWTAPVIIDSLPARPPPPPSPPGAYSATSRPNCPGTSAAVADDAARKHRSRPVHRAAEAAPPPRAGLPLARRRTSRVPRTSPTGARPVTVSVKGGFSCRIVSLTATVQAAATTPTPARPRAATTSPTTSRVRRAAQHLRTLTPNGTGSNRDAARREHEHVRRSSSGAPSRHRLDSRSAIETRTIRCAPNQRPGLTGDEGRAGLNRRQMIKAAGIAGAAAWTAPMIIDSLSSPAAAATVTPGCYSFWLPFNTCSLTATDPIGGACTPTPDGTCTSTSASVPAGAVTPPACPGNTSQAAVTISVNGGISCRITSVSAYVHHSDIRRDLYGPVPHGDNQRNGWKHGLHLRVRVTICDHRPRYLWRLSLSGRLVAKWWCYSTEQRDRYRSPLPVSAASGS